MNSMEISNTCFCLHPASGPVQMSKTPTLKHRLRVQFPALPYFCQNKNIGILIRIVCRSIQTYFPAIGINEMLTLLKLALHLNHIDPI
jgi:hypothetical protein